MSKINNLILKIKVLTLKHYIKRIERELITDWIKLEMGVY